VGGIAREMLMVIGETRGGPWLFNYGAKKPLWFGHNGTVQEDWICGLRTLQEGLSTVRTDPKGLAAPSYKRNKRSPAPSVRCAQDSGYGSPEQQKKPGNQTACEQEKRVKLPAYALPLSSTCYAIHPSSLTARSSSASTYPPNARQFDQPKEACFPSWIR